MVQLSASEAHHTEVGGSQIGTTVVSHPDRVGLP